MGRDVEDKGGKENWSQAIGNFKCQDKELRFLLTENKKKDNLNCI